MLNCDMDEEVDILGKGVACMPSSKEVVDKVAVINVESSTVRA